MLEMICLLFAAIVMAVLFGLICILFVLLTSTFRRELTNVIRTGTDGHDRGADL